jgi:hypothetical protein
MFRFLLYFFLIYLGYQFIFKFLIPIFKTTQQVKKDVRAMYDRMNEFPNTRHSSPTPQARSADTSPKEPTGDYLDFEEIK